MRDVVTWCSVTPPNRRPTMSLLKQVSMSPGLAYAMRCIDDRVFQIAGDMRLLQQLT
jgi:hypothetical protein